MKLTESDLDAQIADKQPPQRSMWQDELDDPRLIRLYGWTFTAAIVASALLTRCS